MTLSATGKRRKKPPAPAICYLHLAGYTVVDLAEEMGVPRHRVIQWLNGRRGPLPEMQRALVALVGRERADEILRHCATRRRTWHPATRLLNAEGLKLQDLAGPLGFDCSTISLMLGGNRPAPPALAALLRHKLGRTRAQPIIDAIPRWAGDPDEPTRAHP